MEEKKTCNDCTKMRRGVKVKTNYYCIEPDNSRNLIYPTIIALNKRACKYYEEKEKGEYVGSALARYNEDE